MSEEEIITSPREDLEWQIRLQSDEIERLNNIINELEFYLVSGTREKPYFRGSLYWNEACEDILDKLQELKGDSSN